MSHAMSPEYQEYVERMQNPPAEPFAPCDRYQPIPDGCAVCAHSIEDEPCPDLKEVFGAFSPTEGGDLSIRRGSTHDGSHDCSGPGGN